MHMRNDRMSGASHRVFAETTEYYWELSAVFLLENSRAGNISLKLLELLAAVGAADRPNLAGSGLFQGVDTQSLLSVPCLTYRNRGEAPP